MTSVIQEHGDERSIFSLWNGDIKALTNGMFNYWDVINDKYFKNEGIIERSLNIKNPFNTYIVKGVYIYFFLFLLEKNANYNNLLYILFTYLKFHKPSKSIRRFLLNYVINHSELNFRPSRIGEIENSGTSFYDLYSTIRDFMNEINKLAKKELYSLDDINHFFEDSYNDKIDYFSHLFTVYKSQIVKKNKVEVNSNFYDFGDELKRMQEENNEYEIDELNKIRIFNNNSAVFFISYLLSHFEFYSFFLSHPDQNSLHVHKPLLFSVNLKNNQSNKDLVEDYEFYDIIEKVLINAKLIVNNIVDFYVQYLIHKYPPKIFISNKFFSYLKDGKVGDFQFRLIIERHITYLEGFRRGLMEDDIVKLEDNIKFKINCYITEKIIAYIELYELNYNKIVNVIPSDNLDFDPKLNASHKYLLERKDIAKNILKDSGKDTQTIIRFTETENI